MFKDRKDAGRKLAAALQAYKEEAPLVLAIPRGGVELGYEVSKALSADFSLIICRKLPFPLNTESGFGAIAEDGSLYINELAATSISHKEIEQIIAQQSLEIKRRIQTLRGGKPLPSIKGRTVIVVDDGIAMGSTMHVAVELCRKRGAKKIIVAVPVASRQAIQKFSQMADEVVVLESPLDFYAVAQVYENWHDVSDKEVLDFL
ncbi:phosphoribosyltransferase [Sulfurimonas autotrophica]|uniref:Phosphoribosyltransferase n=1 Tax=Sulfurimonas autotrophica (strain ATCC BAA-671 / DSM 16294 / JCM 11897 / OK10) TaxID=563040 RepID=E0USP8_SULAO|nr:phosphoribosyltransferase [Sulfurimonas autotrophica]ADN09211.1 phosphoribosyltransferase [Sulfurimonas autotrophica DSM 16294]